MAFTAKQLTKLIDETKKARDNLDKVLDFSDLIKNKSDELPEDLKSEEESIRSHSDEIGKNINVIKKHLQSELDKVPVDPEEVKDAANRLLLYHGTVDHVVVWAGTQMQNHEEHSYWWRYWQGVYNAIMEKHGQE